MLFTNWKKKYKDLKNEYINVKLALESKIDEKDEHIRELVNIVTTLQEQLQDKKSPRIRKRK